MHTKIKEILDEIENRIEYPDIHTIQGASTNPEVTIKDKKILIFCSNNYLGIATDKRIKDEVIKAVEIYGLGSGGSRLVSGNISVQEELEKKIATFKGAEDAITFTTGYMANVGVIPALLNPPITSIFDFVKNKTFLKEKVAVFSDELNHASIVDGIRLSKVDKVIYKHLDMIDLEKGLHKKRRYHRKLIITDGVFSMDGDIAPLDQIVKLAEKYKATIMIDDAHSTGILGDHGKGTLEYFGIKDHPSVIVMGTFTKVFGGIGGFIVGPKDLIKYLRVTARSYIFSAPIPPAISVGLSKSIDIVSLEPERRLMLWSNINHLRNLLVENDFNTLKSETQIVPIYIGDEKKAIAISRRLLELGVFIPCVRWPAVPHGASRLRLTLMSSHTREHIDMLMQALLTVKKEFNI